MGNSSSQQRQPEPPVNNEKRYIPVFKPPTNNEQAKPPANNEKQYTRPNIEQRYTRPDIEQRYARPNIEQRYTRPNIEQRPVFKPSINNEQAKPPVNNEQAKPPVNNEKQYTRPNTEQRYTQPDIAQRWAQPDIAQQWAQPNIEQRYIGPNIEQRPVFKPPINKEQAKPPVNNEQAKPPVNNEKQYTRPNAEQRYTEPNIAQRWAQPNIAQRWAQPNIERYIGPNIERPVFKPPINNGQAKPPVNNKQAESSNRDEATIAAVTAPPKFITKDDFMATWFSWKEEFIAYVASIDKTGANSHMWCIMLLNRMGPVGQEIHRTFPFYDENARDGIKLLCRNFDVYCLYGDKKRGDEDIDKYVNDLKLIAVARNYNNPEVIVKEKIIQDINAQRFTGKAAHAVESKGEQWIPYLQTLSLSNVIFLWKQLEDSMTPKNKETPKQDPPCAKSAVACFRCGTEHNRNQCPAWGTQCNKCKQFNHFTDNCRVIHVNDCDKCGKSHFLSRCPAFGQVCTNCGRRNHFSWKCRSSIVNNCSRCGTSHAISACPTRG